MACRRQPECSRGSEPSHRPGDGDTRGRGEISTTGEAVSGQAVTHVRNRDMAKSSTRLVLICGLPASGKSTLARQLAPKIPAIRLDKDQWATELGHDVWDDEFRVRLEQQLWALTQDLLAQGQSVVWSGATGRALNGMGNDSGREPWG